MDTTKTPRRYARILLDYWFKRSFGIEGRQRLLTLFLQELIPERRIVSLSYGPQEHINPLPDNKGVRVDVECTDEDGTRFVVEMQLSEQKFFYERAVFNSTFAIQEQMLSGESSYGFPAVYFIGIMDFSIHEGADQVLYRYQFRERDSNELMTDRIQYLFLELTNARHALEPDATVLENSATHSTTWRTSRACPKVSKESCSNSCSNPLKLLPLRRRRKSTTNST